MLESERSQNLLTNLLPTHTSNWWPIVEDVFASPACARLLHKLMMQAIEHGETCYLSIDGTFRVCLTLLGQAKFNAPQSTREEYPYKDDESYTRVISIRGRSGAVLGLIPAAGEGASHIVNCLKAAIPLRGLNPVEHVAVDNPSHKLFSELHGILPNLKALSLDPTHAAMHYEQALGRRRSAGSALLRKFMAKFGGYDPNITENIWGPMFEGGTCRLTAQEQILRDEIKEGTMSKRRAARVLAACVDFHVWPTRLQFVEAIAALAATYNTDLTKKIDGTKITVATILYNITAADRLEWLFNCTRYRHFLPHAHRALLPSGTASNEALHAELNSWFRQAPHLQIMSKCKMEWC